MYCFVAFDTVHDVKSVLENKTINISSFESSDKIQKTKGVPYCAISDNESSSVTLNKLTIIATRLYCNLMDLSQGSLNKRLFNSKVGSKSKILARKWYCLENGVQGDFLGPPHGTTPAAVITDKI